MKSASPNVDGSALLTSTRILLFALSAGVLVASLYYVQPLTSLLAASFGVGVTQAGYLVTATQIGYVLGIVFLVPLSDVLNRRKLLTWMLVAKICALILAATSQNIIVFSIASILMGITASALMVVTAMVASYAPDHSRGRMVGTVMTGLLLGILLARTVSGVVAQVSGSWRAVYLLAAVVVAALLAILRNILPDEAPRGKLQYAKLMASLAGIIRQEPLLRQRALFAGLGLGTFSVFWTGLTFLLSGAPYHYSEMQIGFFGLVGATGAFAANTAGRMADRGYARQATWLLALASLASWAFIAFGAVSLLMLLVGVVLLDVGVMGLQVTHQSIIYKLAPEARARVTTVFIAAGFIGASAGSALASASYAAGGWLALCLVGAAMPLLMVIVWSKYRLRQRGL
ncbi:MFS transporter [Janthinobacterium agaricidamnosum]|uniref:Major Facilitator Superfamily protein n=1 Tax=Janthinobacterium agaricidamnosum NBRC 102515 = DSM 9628 TaxID=1349767 RepID=W0VAD4_9BURK|nr:MFS transporter [Janthinobacterium agaricidamnosum]CDG84846.1 major Facilitator Superfamily protein [Janthinobacterium agaricidamnosum NBRC 102515 = DSM 9628]